MSSMDEKLKIAFVHPDLGIGGAERLVVDAALGLQRLGHSADIYTSHHDPKHCFEETRDGTLRVHNIRPPFPRSIAGKLHIVFAHLRQLHLTLYLLLSKEALKYDVFFVDQLSTCVPLLRTFAGKRVVFYVHFPDKLLAAGEFVEGRVQKKGGFLKRMYRVPMDWLEEVTTGNADILLANSNFTSRIFKAYFSIPQNPRVVYPGINITAYKPPSNPDDTEIISISSSRPTLLSLNRFEKKKNAALAVQAFAIFRKELSSSGELSKQNYRLVLAGGYDPRLVDNIETLQTLRKLADDHKLRYRIIAPELSLNTSKSAYSDAESYDILFLLNFTTSQRSALLTSPSTRVLMYTPANEHFGIGPVEGMACGLPVLACNSGGPTESIVAEPVSERTGWLEPPIAEEWAKVLLEVVRMSDEERNALAVRAKERAEAKFGMKAMAKCLEELLYDAVEMGDANYVFQTFLLGLTFAALLVALVLARILFH